MLLMKLNPCCQRFGRIKVEYDEFGGEKIRAILTCGYMEVDTEECLRCQDIENPYIHLIFNE